MSTGSAPDALDDHNVFNRWSVNQRFVGVLLQRHDGTSTIAAVRCNQHLCLRVVNPIAQRLCAEATEHNTVRGADAVTGVHRDNQLRHHAHVKADAVTFLDAELLQNIGELVDLPPHVPIGEHALVAWLSFPDNGGFVLSPAFYVPIETIVRGVELPADKPFGPGRIPFQHLFPRLEPFQLLGGFGPKRLGILPGRVENAGASCVSRFLERLRRRKVSLLV